MNKLTSEMITRMRELRVQGWTYERIGEEFGVSYTTVSYHLDSRQREKQYKKNKRMQEAGYQKRWRSEHPDYMRRYMNQRLAKARASVIALLGEKCLECGNDDRRVLQINHLDGNDGKTRREPKDGSNFCVAILKGQRSTKDLNLLCANCNQIYEYKVGRRNELRYDTKQHFAAVSLLGGKCAKCGTSDLRVLQFNHINGNGKKDYDNYGGGTAFCGAILNGRRGTSGLSVLCANCNIIYEYEQGRRKEGVKQ